MTQIQNAHSAPKRDWIRPGLKRLEAGAAESQAGGNTDGGGGLQGS
ncbi:MAG TPA: hypothetical protein VF688_02815 [Allosphingosinicella sp.]|jgi:hypothetical protein